MRKKFTLPQSPKRKVAPVNMRREEHQFVIDGYLVDEVLKQIPAQIKIVQAYINLMNRVPDVRIAVPNVLKKLGVTAMRDSGARKTVSVIFDKPSKEFIKQQVSKICKILNFPYEKAYFRYVVLSNTPYDSKEYTALKFEHCTKEIKPNELDLRKKLRVLGATTGQGKVQSLISELGAHKYSCVIKEEPAKFIMCSKE